MIEQLVLIIHNFNRNTIVILPYVSNWLIYSFLTIIAPQVHKVTRLVRVISTFRLYQALNYRPEASIHLRMSTRHRANMRATKINVGAHRLKTSKWPTINNQEARPDSHTFHNCRDQLHNLYRPLQGQLQATCHQTISKLEIKHAPHRTKLDLRIRHKHSNTIHKSEIRHNFHLSKPAPPFHHSKLSICKDKSRSPHRCLLKLHLRPRNRCLVIVSSRWYTQCTPNYRTRSLVCCWRSTIRNCCICLSIKNHCAQEPKRQLPFCRHSVQRKLLRPLRQPVPLKSKGG